MCATNGSPVYNTFKITVRIKGKSILILVDPGSTHNIINSALVEKLRLETEVVPSYTVSLANGKEVKGRRDSAVN